MFHYDSLVYSPKRHPHFHRSLKSKKPPSLLDVADAAFVHRTPVSFALRESPRLPAARRDEIKRFVGQLGYRPRPVISALMAYWISRRAHKYHATLAVMSVDKNLPLGWLDDDTAYGITFFSGLPLTN